MISEFPASRYAEGVQASFESSLVVVRGVLSRKRAHELAALTPRIGRQRLLTHPLLAWQFRNAVEAITETRSSVGRVITDTLGPLATMGGAYLQLPDMSRAGPVRPHIDGRNIMLSTSVNLATGSQATILYGERIASPLAPFDAIHTAWQQSGLKSPRDFTDWVELEAGDALIVGRGVLHGSVSDPARQSVVYRTRGIIT
ncbi:MAG: hypothetical protein JWM81_93 [Candidatus Saccharibacteria bacterium]|nr:hypothetical protein [Candidatus Saccharibacteria bacterium]